MPNIWPQIQTAFGYIPPYVILSHTWGKGEVTFDDIDKPYAREMAGYYKIERCCQQAALDGFEWVWVDTCCIDKRSSSELQEAINSMYHWYWYAEICYAYLEDVSADSQGLLKCRWFTRGWTLQEILAPLVVEFFDRDWRRIGTKSSLIEAITSRTRIDKRYLLDRETIKDACIAAKFSWASQRETTRPEDIAYCLLGLVDVNMPMLYGEGTKAFYRLQLELLKKSNEHSIFAWEDPFHHLPGMLAPSPEYFSEAGQYTMSEAYSASTHEMTNKGLRITLGFIGNGKEKAITG
ncbi:HET-domain-containing protein [Periconia macrospinosa]|uniref:HET-domain-containing protein n=1 Tax=Periconia macrospinosa TaxID=97972 RepID=A0A2V1CYP1_9PLEO|nr:HET-domain-containing protein [Periconia macrospinosa]